MGKQGHECTNLRLLLEQIYEGSSGALGGGHNSLFLLAQAGRSMAELQEGGRQFFETPGVEALYISSIGFRWVQGSGLGGWGIARVS